MKMLDLNEMAQNETEILTRLNHENIVKYLDHFEVENQNYREIKLCIVTEFCEVSFLLIFSLKFDIYIVFF